MDFEALFSPKPAGLDREEIVRRLTALVNYSPRGPDLKLFAELCSPDIICEFIGDRSRIPYAGRHVGVEALISIVRAINTDFEQLNGLIRGVVVDGGRVAGRRSVDWRHRGTGRQGRVDLADFVKFEDGLIVELIEFRDSIALLEMQGDR